MERPRLRQVQVERVQSEGGEGYALHDPSEIAEGVALVPLPAAVMLNWFDGQHDVAAICERFREATGLRVREEQVRQVVERLDRGLLLDSPRFAAHLAALVEVYRARPARPATFAGRIYPEDEDGCRARLEGILGQVTPLEEQGLVGLIAPHIDYARGERAYALAYRAVQAAPMADLYVLLGTVHAPLRRAFTLTRQGFETPYGVLPVATRVVDDLVGVCGDWLLADEVAHEAEHSLELQAVWLAHLFAGRAVKPRILPVLCGSLHRWVVEGGTPDQAEGYRRFIATLRGCLDAFPGRVCLIAGADLAHLGPMHGDATDLDEGALGKLEAEDRATLVLASRLDREGFFRDVARGENGRHICGLAPCYALMGLLAGRVARGEVLDYGQAVDGPTRSVVSYGVVRYVAS